MDEEAKAFRVSEFCKRYVISKASVYREIAADRLRIVKRGHTTLITLDLYSHVTDTMQGEAATKLDAVFRAAIKARKGPGPTLG